jgi:transcriptional regulator with XRE-family HTH domain
MDNPRIRKRMFRNEVSKRIFDAMNLKGFNKADLARALETSPSNISQILNGDRNLTLDKLCEISMALDMVPSFEFKDKNEVYDCSFVVTDVVSGVIDSYADIPHFEECLFRC